MARVSGKGYLVMHCGCGAHMETFHKTPSNPNHFKQKAAFMIRMCSTRGGAAMLTIDAQAWLDLPREFTDDELADLIVAVIDYLDDHVLDPSVGTTRTPEGTQVRVSMTFSTDDPWIAQTRALNALRTAFDAAVPEITGLPRGLAFAVA